MHEINLTIKYLVEARNNDIRAFDNPADRACYEDKIWTQIYSWQRIQKQLLHHAINYCYGENLKIEDTM